LARVDASAVAVEKNCRIEFVKTDSYNQWRFNSNPHYKYEKFSTQNGTFAVTKLFEDPLTGNKVGDIVDYRFGADFKQLFETVVSSMKEKGAAAITTWALPQTSLNSLLTQNGFKTMHQERYFCVKPFVLADDLLTKIDNWNLVQADAEIY
jgi:hypothetical protein